MLLQRSPIPSSIPAVFAVLLLAASSRASIIYTDLLPDTHLDFPGILPIDLNNDGTTDFSLRMLEGSFIHAGMTFYYPEIRITTASGNAIEGAINQSYNVPFPAQLSAGDSIDALRSFVTPSDNVLATGNPSGGPYPWPGSVNAAFLGLRLQSGPDTFYGWARITLQSNTHIILHDYAYESQPGFAIIAGNIPEPSTLTLLPLAAATLLLTRRKHHQRA